MAEYDEQGNRIPEYLGMRDAAKRVKRSRRTIRRWMAGGMPYKWFEGRKFVELGDLQFTLRQKMSTSPIKTREQRERIARGLGQKKVSLHS